jgi:hypothetical protein
MTYGPLSSAANVGTSMLSTYAAPAIEDYLSGAIESPWLRKAIAAGLPAIAAGGIGAATSGDKYGWMNALPAGIMGAMSLPGDSKNAAQLAEAKRTISDADPASITKGQKLGADTNAIKQYGGMPSSEDVFKTPDILKAASKSETAAGDSAKAATSGGGEDMGGIFGKLMSTPEGKLMVAMMLGNTFSGLATTAGTDAYYNKLNRQTNQANALVGQRQRQYINQALGYAMGGPVAPTVVRNPAHLHPQSMIPKADPHTGAAQVKREVVTPPTQFKHGELVGPGDGMSDSIEANIDGKRKAKVATGEYVVPREAAEKYGDKLNKMMKAVRAAAHPKKGEQVKQDAAKREFIKQMSGVKA